MRPDLFDIEVAISGHEKIFGKDAAIFKNQVQLDNLSQAQKYRFIIYTEGECGWADRLKIHLFTNSTILMQLTPCYEYYRELMKPYEHYIPVDGMFKNLTHQVEWAIKNPEKAEKISVNAWKLGREYLSQRSIQCYMDLIFAKYTSLMRYKPSLRPDAKVWKQQL